MKGKIMEKQKAVFASIKNVYFVTIAHFSTVICHKY
jgi:hypothetical protein